MYQFMIFDFPPPPNGIIFLHLYGVELRPRKPVSANSTN